MQNLFIKETKYTPKIHLDIESGIFNVAGKSYPENTFEFYRPVLNWLESYLENLKDKELVINLDLEYLNSSSLKIYFDFLDIIETVNENNTIEINWIYDKENDIAEETGEDFMSDFSSLSFNLVRRD